MDKFDSMKQKELRAACKAAGLKGYGNATQDEMRQMLRAHAGMVEVWQDKPAIQFSDSDKAQLAAEAQDRNNGVLPKDMGEQEDDDLSDIPAEFLADEDNFEMSAAELAQQAGRDPSDGDCPSCGIHLSNGLLMPDDEAANSNGKTLYETGQLNREFECMGCGHQWGKEYPPFKKAADPEKPKRQQAKGGSSQGLQIEPNRPTRNGVTRPSIGGKCRDVWDMLDEIGSNATAKQAREEAAKRGYDKTTTMVQFYKWRKFNGISGR